MKLASSESVASLKEFALIDRLTRGLKTPAGSGVVGVGDDCAVFPLSLFTPVEREAWLVVTNDALVEERHFRLRHKEARLLGGRLVAVTISDIAAMGGKAEALIVNAQLRKDLELSWIDEFYTGLREACALYGVMLAGGNTTSASELSFCASAFGICTRPPLLRSGARVGDDVWVSGEVGGAGVGLAVADGSIMLEDEAAARARARYFCPVPQLRLGKLLLEQGLATGAIDVSDGLVQDAAHIGEQSAVSLVLDFSRIPCDRCVMSDLPARAAAVTAGDDYELLFTARPDSADALAALSGRDGLPRLTKIGVVENAAGTGAVFLRAAESGLQLPSGASCWEKVSPTEVKIPAAEFLALIRGQSGDVRTGYQHF